MNPFIGIFLIVLGVIITLFLAFVINVGIPIVRIDDFLGKGSNETEAWYDAKQELRRRLGIRYKPFWHTLGKHPETGVGYWHFTIYCKYESLVTEKRPYGERITLLQFLNYFIKGQ